jgi:integrase
VSAANTFSAIAEELIAKREREGLKDVTNGKARWLLSLLAADIGDRPIAEIEPYELLDTLKKVEASGRLETAKRLLAFASRVFRYAVGTTRAKRNIAADLGTLVAPKVKHHAAIIDPDGVGALLHAIEGFDGQPVTMWAGSPGTSSYVPAS